ncbi:kinase, partial [Klebsiella pneumoniae]|nr:kinase [Klebsiella pneumoniae]
SETQGDRESMPEWAVFHHSLNRYERNVTLYCEE